MVTSTLFNPVVNWVLNNLNEIGHNFKFDDYSNISRAFVTLMECHYNDLFAFSPTPLPFAFLVDMIFLSSPDDPETLAKLARVCKACYNYYKKTQVWQKECEKYDAMTIEMAKSILVHTNPLQK